VSRGVECCFARKVGERRKIGGIWEGDEGALGGVLSLDLAFEGLAVVGLGSVFAWCLRCGGLEVVVYVRERERAREGEEEGEGEGGREGERERHG